MDYYRFSYKAILHTQKININNNDTDKKTSYYKLVFKYWHAQGESNPCYRRERAMS